MMANKTRAEPYQVALLVVEIVAGDVGVEVLEDLIEAELAETLGRVADKGGEPALDHTCRCGVRTDMQHMHKYALATYRQHPQ